MGKLSTRVIIAENPYADIDMPEVPSEVPVGSGENISESICISRGKIVRVTDDVYLINLKVEFSSNSEEGTEGLESHNWHVGFEKVLTRDLRETLSN